MTRTDFRGLIDALARARVEFIVIGGIAAAVHGSARATMDLDVLYRRSADNVDRLVGALDLLGEVPGGGSYDTLLPYTEMVELFGHSCRVVTLDRLIVLKRASGRPKDYDVLAELEALRDRRRERE